MMSWTFEIEPDDAEVGDPYGPVQKSRSKGSCSALEQLYMVNTWLIWAAVKIGKKCNLIFFIGCENQWVYQE